MAKATHLEIRDFQTADSDIIPYDSLDAPEKILIVSATVRGRDEPIGRVGWHIFEVVGVR
jgi:hypothetical protein